MQFLKTVFDFPKSQKIGPYCPGPQLSKLCHWPIQDLSRGGAPNFYRPRTYVRREVMFSQVCVCSGGGTRSQIFGGGTRSQIFGGVPGLKFSGGVPGLKFSGGGYLVSVKGKLFDTRFGLIHVQTGKKFFVTGPPPPRNCKKLLWLHGGWYASCVHAGGLSCFLRFCQCNKAEFMQAKRANIG